MQNPLNDPEPPRADEELRAAAHSALAWLERWAVHVGNCLCGDRCTCGLTAIRAELYSAIDPEQN